MSNSRLPVTAAVTTPRPKHLNQQKLAELAYEVARDLRELPDILRTFALTEAVYREHVETDQFYKRVLEAAMVEWASTGSTKTRIKFQAALALEQGIIPLTQRMMDSEEDLGKAVEAAKLLAKIAGMDAPVAGEGGPGEKFTITINLGADNQLKIEKDITPGPEVINGDGAGEGATPAPNKASTIFQITEGAGDPEAV